MQSHGFSAGIGEHHQIFIRRNPEDFHGFGEFGAVIFLKALPA